MEGKRVMQPSPEENNKKKRRGIVTALLIIIIIIILLLLRSCGGLGNSDDGPIGNFNVTDTQQQEEKEPVVDEDIPSITFAGFGKAIVSSKHPTIELYNPDNNFVDMVFTVTDEESGEVIARTDKVKAGEYVYVNVMEFYKTAGKYQLDIDISTTDHETGEGMNGLHEDVDLTVE